MFKKPTPSQIHLMKKTKKSQNLSSFLGESKLGASFFPQASSFLAREREDLLGNKLRLSQSGSTVSP